jgi:hypothetical protein
MKCEHRRHRFEPCFNFVFNQFCIQSILELFDLDFLPIGLKSKQGRYMLNMRMALAARTQDRPVGDRAFMCLNPRGSG